MTASMGIYIDIFIAFTAGGGLVVDLRAIVHGRKSGIWSEFVVAGRTG